MKFYVEVTRKSYARCSLEIQASDVKEAKRLAIEYGSGARTTHGAPRPANAAKTNPTESPSESRGSFRSRKKRRCWFTT